MMEADKIRMTKKYMTLVRRSYTKFETEYESLCSSRGMTARWGGAGGRSGRVSRPTQGQAVAKICFDEEWAEMARWFECMRRTYLALGDSKGKGLNRWRHDKIVAHALQLFVFKRAGREEMRYALGTGVPVSDRYIERFLTEAVMAVKDEAERAGLFSEAGREDAMKRA